MKKRRVFQHGMEERSRALVRSILPREWVVRDYMPDYGIDIAVEIFETVGDPKAENGVAEAIGELFFAQIKSTGREIVRRLKVCPRHSAEKGFLGDAAIENKDDFEEVDAIPYRIDTKLLSTVQSLRAGIPVLLFLVTLDTESRVCIEKFSGSSGYWCTNLDCTRTMAGFLRRARPLGFEQEAPRLNWDATSCRWLGHRDPASRLSENGG